MDKRFLAILAGLIIIFGGIFVFSQDSNDKSSSDSSKATNHIEGEGKKNVTLVEYGDYQCPVCGLYYQPVKDAVAKYSEDIKFQFRNLPLTSIHPNAFGASRAAEAAGLQGKYFEMHSMLYEGQSAWSDSSSPLKIFQGYAQQLGLNLEQFNSDYPSSKVNDAINADLEAFKNTGQNQATPAFFINGKFVENSKFADAKTGAPTAESIGKLIEEAIAENSKK